MTPPRWHPPTRRKNRARRLQHDHAMKAWIIVGLVSVGAVACSAGAPPAEHEESSGEALTILPEAVCTLIAGVDKSGLQANQLQLKVAGGSSPDPNVVAFQTQIRSLKVGTLMYTIAAPGPESWYALDVTGDDSGTVASIVNAYANVSPVWAGYYSCTYLWGDYELPPGGKRPYVPRLISAFDPRACSSCM